MEFPKHPFRRCRLIAAAALLVTLSAAPSVSAEVAASSGRVKMLREGSAAQRREALDWLRNYGDYSAVSSIVQALRDDDAAVRELAEGALWDIWTRSGDPEVDSILHRGARLMSAGRLRAAVQYFSRVIATQPDFAEGYNKRATALYHLGDFEGSMADIAQVLSRNPFHFGALSGAGLCMLELRRPVEALAYFDRALRINPNLESVRGMASRLRNFLRRRSI